jgi:ATP-binding cassette subfamily B protein
VTEERQRPLTERFPAVERLERRSQRRRVPVVQQLHLADCGAACLAMVLRFYGKNVSLDDVRDSLGGGQEGVSALALLEAAHRFGLRGRAVRLDLQDLDFLQPGAILHWQLKHFVVLDRVTRHGVEIVDPAVGRRRVSAAEFGKSFTGVALLLEPAAEFEPLSLGPSRVWRYLRGLFVHSGLMSRILVTSVFAQAIVLALPILTGLIVDRVVPRGDADLLLVIAAGIAMITVFGFLASYLRAHLLLRLRTHLDLQMTLDFFEHLLRLPFSFFQLRQTGDLMMRLDSNATIREMLTTTAITALLDGSLVTVYLVVLLLTHLQLGLLVLLLGALRVLIYLGTQRRHRELMSESLQAQAESANYQVQMIEGIETLKVTGTERRALEHWSNLFVEVMNVALKRGELGALVSSTLEALATASPLILLGYGGHLVLAGSLSLGTMLAMNALAAGFLGPLSSLVGTGLQLQTLRSYIERVDDVLEKTPEQRDAADAAPSLAGRVAVANVSFRYSEATPWVLKNVDLEIETGTRIAIVGRSGSGKSTLARLLVGLYVPSEGEILYDGENLAHYELGSVRRQIGFVPQVPFLFASTIRSNISMADRDTPLREIQWAAEMAHVHHEIMDMPLKYETPVASGGANLSGGQRQRIALARALLRRPRILVLDEATSHLDTLAERRIHENLRGLEATRIVIAHRLSTVVDSDRILVTDRGEIVETGTHSELMKSAGLYAQLYRSQQGETL